MKKVLLFLVSFLAIALTNIKAQTIVIDGEKQANQVFVTGSAGHDVENLRMEVTANYNMESREITLLLTPKFEAYDFVWMPMSSYGYTKLKRELRQQLFVKFKETKLFKSQFETGVRPLFECKNCELNESGSSDLKHDVLKNGEGTVFHFKVQNPKQQVEVTLRNIIPILIKEKRFGKPRYVFQYVSDPVAIKIVVPNNPCLLRTNKNLLAESNSLNDKLNDQYEALSQARGRRDRKAFKEIKERVENDYKQQVKALLNKYDEQNNKCLEIKQLLDDCNEILMAVDTSQMRIPPIPTPTIDNVAKIFNDASVQLIQLTDAIRSGNNVAASRRTGGALIAEMDTKLNSLSHKDRSSLKNEKAINNYLKAKKGFERNNK